MQEIQELENQRIKRRDRYWRQLRAVNKEYNKLTLGTEYHDATNGFYYYLQHNYGIKPGMDHGQKFTDTYEIVDEKKYLLFQMKYSDL